MITGGAVIVRKLQYAAQGGGDRHLRHIKRMLERALIPVDQTVVRSFAEELGLLSIWITTAGAPP